jgi:2'-5' RNA ligase superfamily protein
VSGTVAHAVELQLDEAAARKVLGLLAVLEAAGVDPITGGSPHAHPHVSVAVAADEGAEAVKDALVGVATAGLPPLRLSSVGAFVTPIAVVFLGVTPSAALLELNRRVHARLDAARVAAWPLYRPGTWVPHCTLAMRPADLTAALSALRAAVLPIEASPIALRIVEVPTGKPTGTIG